MLLPGRPPWGGVSLAPEIAEIPSIPALFVGLQTEATLEWSNGRQAMSLDGRSHPAPLSIARELGQRIPPGRAPSRRATLVSVAQATARRGRDEVVPLDGADRLEPEVWNRLAHRGFHLHHWFTAAERHGWNPRHVAVHAAQELKAIVPAYLVGPDTPQDLHHRWLGPLRDLAERAGLHLQPIVSVQAPFAHISELLGDVSALSSATLHEIFYRLEQTAHREGAKAVAWPFVDTGSIRLMDVARDRGYAVLYSGATAILPIRWPSFDEYVASRSRNLRRTIRADLAAIGASGLRTTLTSDFECDASRMDRLYRDSFRHRNRRPSPLAPNFFQYLGRRPTPALRAHLTWHGDHLVGTSLNLATPGWMDGTFSGFSPEHRNGPVLYNDLCYEPIRMAASEGIPVIDLGPTALYAKVLRGAILQRRMILIRGTTQRRHRLLSALGKLVANRTQNAERRSLGALWGPRCFGDEDG
jgi:predicted N-acyltransferase